MHAPSVSTRRVLTCTSASTRFQVYTQSTVCRKGGDRALTILKPDQQAAPTDHLRLQLSQRSVQALHRHFGQFPASTAEVQATQADSGAALVQELLPDGLRNSGQGALKS